MSGDKHSDTAVDFPAAALEAAAAASSIGAAADAATLHRSCRRASDCR